MQNDSISVLFLLWLCPIHVHSFVWRMALLLWCGMKSLASNVSRCISLLGFVCKTEAKLFTLPSTFSLIKHELYMNYYTWYFQKVQEEARGIYREIKNSYTIHIIMKWERWIMLTLQKLREMAVLTQVEVADQIGVSATTISHWETGSKRPRASNIRKLAAVLGVTPQDILVALQETVDAQEQREWRTIHL